MFDRVVVAFDSSHSCIVSKRMIEDKVIASIVFFTIPPIKAKMNIIIIT
jgi:hypothetical protein